MRILVIEDEKKLSAALERALKLQKYAVDVAADGESGFNLAVSEEYDVIISDIMLPKMDGYQICQLLREQGIHTPVLMLTAKGQIEDKIASLDGGADDHLVKPFSFEELFARIRMLLRRNQKMMGPSLVLGDLELNPATFTVTRAGKVVALSQKEYSILEYLLRHPGQVLSREKIVQHVWNYQVDILPATVEVHIKHLRDKVDAGHSDPLIHTVRGFGYKIGTT